MDFTGLAVRTVGLSRYFGPTKAVDQLTLEVPRGAIFGFLGPNGSGKTTTIRLLLGLLRPTAGYAEVAGLDIRTHSSEIRERAGVLLDHHGLYEQMSALDNLEFWARVWKMDHRERSIRIKELLERSGLWDRRTDRVSQWSLGMKKRLSLVRALLTRPEIVLLDEPTAGLDVTSAVAVRNDLADLAAQYGATVFLSTHNMNEAEQLCSLVAVIRSGRLTALGSPDSLRAQAGRPRIDVLGRGFSAEVLQLLANQSYVASVTGEETRLVVELRGTTDPAPLVELLVNAGASIEEVRRDTASLEEVFLRLMEEAAEEEGEGT